MFWKFQYTLIIRNANEDSKKCKNVGLSIFLCVATTECSGAGFKAYASVKQVYSSFCPELSSLSVMDNYFFNVVPLANKYQF